MNTHVILAIFKRNFAGYFSSPIGYVFICAFVLLSAFAAFWPNEFFNANLANLDQLNQRLPWIMLVIIPAITMSVWAEERRQGTDELLLTLPAGDLEVVVGKYAASLAIFAVALVFSLFNVVVLYGLGSPDPGLLVGNYVGYFVVGAGMLAVGMAASFLTSNLTVSFILAAAFNAPLAFASSADSVLGRELAQVAQSFSIAEQFRDFGRGVVTLRNVVFFATLAMVFLYLCMVFIGRRHWAGRRTGLPMPAHYLVRALALVAIALGLNVLAARFDARIDVSSAKLSSLSPQTKDLLARLDARRPVLIEAYVSPVVPEDYVQTRLNLLNMLREVSARGGDRVMVRVHDTERFSDAAFEGEQQFGINAQQVQARERGSFSVKDIYLGVAVMAGLDKVVIPFFDRGMPAEYELIRSIATVSEQKRRRIGVIATDAKLFGGFDMQSMSRRPAEQLIEELKKQYDVVSVDPASPITDRFDALLAVQPSSLPQAQLDNLIAAIRAGQPAAIFEDPFPYIDPTVAATSQPRVPPGGNSPFSRQQPPEPKGDIQTLWNVLQVRMPDRDIVWQEYNAYPKISEFSKTPEFVFIDQGCGAAEPFNAGTDVTSGLQQVMLLFPGGLQQASDATLRFTPLVTTGRRTGTVFADEIIERDFLGRGSVNERRRRRPTGEPYVLAALVHGKPASAAPAPPPEGGTAEPPAEQPEIKAIVVADIDVLYSVFFAMRAQGAADERVNFNFDNVTFVLNALDSLAGDERFIAVRNRRPAHRTLTAVQDRTERARQVAAEEREKFNTQYDQKVAEEQKRLQDAVEEIRKQEGIDPKALLQQVALAQDNGEKRLKATTDRLQRERDKALEQSERELALQVRGVQDDYKHAAVAIPTIPPLLLALLVFLRRRSLERIGVPKERLRHD